MTRTALVTGGTRGIGGAISMALKSAGHTVVANYAGNEEVARAFADATGIKVVKFDVGDFQSSTDGLAKAEELAGAPIDILVNNAGITRDTMFHKMSKAQWDEVVNVDLGSMFNVTRPLIDGLRERGWGRIINISSINGQKGQMGQVNYSAAKAGVIGLTKTIAREYAGRNITCNAIAPGFIASDMTAELGPEIEKKILTTIPLNRYGQPDEVAGLVKFLALDPAGAYITGQTICIDGGMVM